MDRHYKELYHGTNRKRTFEEFGSYAAIPVAEQDFKDYAKALVNPFLKIPAKIPDLSCYPTTALTFETSFNWLAAAPATAANTQILDICFGAGVVGICTSNGDGTGTYGQASTAQIDTNFKGPSASLTSVYDKARLVSAGVRITFADNDTNCAGVIGILPTSRQTSADGAWCSTTAGTIPADMITVTDQGNHPLLYTGSITNGVKYVYRPVDSDSFTMVDVTNAGTANNSVNKDKYGGLVCFVTGGSVAGVQLRVDIVATWEATVYKNFAGALSVSPVNSASLNYGLNVAVANPQVGSVEPPGKRKYSSAP